jgi:peptidoglycan-N-acetylglucosamine deacetylase
MSRATLTPRLTFDDGPSESTGAILDLLAEYRVRAHFFVIGARAKEAPDLIARAAAEGHTIGNHTWDHAALAELPDDTVLTQLARTNHAIAAILGAAPTLFRGPYGSVDARIEQLASTLGLTHMAWDVVTQDFSAPDVATILSAILGAEADATVLLHDGNGAAASGPRGRPKTVEALRRALAILSARTNGDT